ncbi:mitotic-spindle organizing gamma-tubulin ring associated-domain-containing protein [Triangularia setosa]|uniref:Mitotic-spindle organizing protein 1 n=1 Tax=Triangularia setosa TaxID=2587417 RepID=A0AAN7A3C6_9PEZI|nr:mitotic-spindle organizing gamma-tubulin ring associated-domain-containing protein [Podospora setosa]
MADRTEKQAAAQQAVDILHEISTLLNCHLDRRTLSICISMIENGVNPEALAVRGSQGTQKGRPKRATRSCRRCCCWGKPEEMSSLSESYISQN